MHRARHRTVHYLPRGDTVSAPRGTGRRGHVLAVAALAALPLAGGALACAAPAADAPPAPVVADAPPATVVVDCSGAIVCERAADGGTVLVDRDSGAAWYVAPAASDPAPTVAARLAADAGALARCAASPAPAGYVAPTVSEAVAECLPMVRDAARLAR